MKEKYLEMIEDVEGVEKYRMEIPEYVKEQRDVKINDLLK